MTNFWDSDVWGFLTLLGLLLGGLMFANFLKRKIGFLRRSLIPASVLAGIVLLAVSFAYTMIVGKNEAGQYQNLFRLPFSTETPPRGLIFFTSLPTTA